MVGQERMVGGTERRTAGREREGAGSKRQNSLQLHSSIRQYILWPDRPATTLSNTHKHVHKPRHFFSCKHTGRPWILPPHLINPPPSTCLLRCLLETHT